MSESSSSVPGESTEGVGGPGGGVGASGGDDLVDERGVGTREDLEGRTVEDLLAEHTGRSVREGHGGTRVLLEHRSEFVECRAKIARGSNEDRILVAHVVGARCEHHSGEQCDAGEHVSAGGHAILRPHIERS